MKFVLVLCLFTPFAQASTPTIAACESALSHPSWSAVVGLKDARLSVWRQHLEAVGHDIETELYNYSRQSSLRGLSSVDSSHEQFLERYQAVSLEAPSGDLSALNQRMKNLVTLSNFMIEAFKSRRHIGVKVESWFSKVKAARLSTLNAEYELMKTVHRRILALQKYLNLQTQVETRLQARAQGDLKSSDGELFWTWNQYFYYYPSLTDAFGSPMIDAGLQHAADAIAAGELWVDPAIRAVALDYDDFGSSGGGNEFSFSDSSSTSTSAASAGNGGE